MGYILICKAKNPVPSAEGYIRVILESNLLMASFYRSEFRNFLSKRLNTKRISVNCHSLHTCSLSPWGLDRAGLRSRLTSRLNQTRIPCKPTVDTSRPTENARRPTTIAKFPSLGVVPELIMDPSLRGERRLQVALQKIVQEASKLPFKGPLANSCICTRQPDSVYSTPPVPLSLLNLLKVKGKGRLKGALRGRVAPSNTRRDPSFFELPLSSAPVSLS
ncbi:uncharacterized protein RAG0_06387 [Rhynchosporium agropyri]|uniref:Uncharacterized protein n=1 Tax=Rhynchosporium agropyri TaxID=914238 RepID=A0A1E1KGN4_9HELO|nr:uncharacterized protein RAG0_06387 [Rhynchosporium agropyri]